MKMILYIIGIIIALAGILGFFNNPVVGILDTNAVQNVVYIILGLMVIISTKKGHAMMTKIIGIIFAILGILGLVGFVTSGGTILGVAESTNAVNWFHLIVGVVLLIIGFMSKKSSGSSAPMGGSNMGGGTNNPQMPPQQPHNPQM